MDKVLIAMSGGVDSSVAAFLMKEQGCECIGATMKLFHNEDIGVSRTKTCCSLEDVEDARLVALHLGIPYYVFNFSDDFKGQVIDRFISSYERGATPNPCIDCNRYLKFERLYERARILGCDAIVTGHYARIEQENGRWLLKKSLDESKDQSYVLYSLTQDQLAHTRLPLGAMHKSETRRIAEEQGFYNANKPDSQDICFVPDGDYAGFIARYTGRDCPAGDFVDESGRVLGRHKGIVHYTVGQRKGLGIAADAPLYVKRIDAAENRVVLSGNDALFSRELMANDFNWIAYDVPPRELRATARVRYHQREQAATVTVLEDGDTAYFATLPVKTMVKRINASGIPALMSYTAGTYVCNSIMYNVLYLLDRRFPGVKGGFIHVPYATAQGVGKPNGTPTMEIATMAKAIEAAIEAAVSVDEDATDIMGETH